MQRRRRRASRPSTARSACSSTTPATARAARSRRSTIDAVRRQFETNVFGLVRMCQLVLPRMREQRWGKIVNISSMGANFVVPGRRLLPRDQVRARRAHRRAALRGQGLRRRRRHHPARADHDRVRRDGDDALDRAARAEAAPYAKFNAHVAQGDRGRLRDRARWRKLGGPPEAVAKVIEKAITAKRPKARYLVTPSRAPARQPAPAHDRPHVGRG